MQRWAGQVVHDERAKVQKVSRSASMAARFRRLQNGDVRGLSPKAKFLCGLVRGTAQGAERLCLKASNSDLLSEGVRRKKGEKKKTQVGGLNFYSAGLDPLWASLAGEGTYR